jgi:hypothetical protein
MWPLHVGVGERGSHGGGCRVQDAVMGEWGSGRGCRGQPDKRKKTKKNRENKLTSVFFWNLYWVR